MGKMEVRSLRSNGGSPLEEEEEEGTKLFPWMRKKKGRRRRRSRWRGSRRGAMGKMEVRSRRSGGGKWWN